MTSEFVARLQAVDHAALTPLVRKALNDASAELLDWRYDPIYGGLAQEFGGSYGIYRFGGTARTQYGAVDWSLILKALGPSSLSSQDPTEFAYWKREALAFQSGILDDLPGDLMAPCCFGVDEYPGGEFWIWLEDIPREENSRWSLERYGLAARHLGQFNGAYLVDLPLPEAPWLSRGRVRDYLSRGETTLRDLRSVSDQPLARLWLTGNLVERILALWADRESLLTAMDRLPRTFCHFDAYRRNLIARREATGTDRTVAIDWSITGIGAIGEEIAPLFVQSLQFFEVEMSTMLDLERAVFAGYVEGLRDAGWFGDPRLARFGFVATAALYKGVGFVGFLPYFLSDEGSKAAEKTFGRPIAEFFTQWSELQHHLLDLGDEAREMMGVLA